MLSSLIKRIDEFVPLNPFSGQPLILGESRIEIRETAKSPSEKASYFSNQSFTDEPSKNIPYNKNSVQSSHSSERNKQPGRYEMMDKEYSSSKPETFEGKPNSFVSKNYLGKNPKPFHKKNTGAAIDDNKMSQGDAQIQPFYKPRNTYNIPPTHVAQSVQSKPVSFEVSKNYKGKNPKPIEELKNNSKLNVLHDGYNANPEK